MDSDEIMALPDVEREDYQRRLNRQLARVYRMYAAYRREEDGEVMDFIEYARLFHNIDSKITSRWLSAGELS